MCRTISGRRRNPIYASGYCSRDNDRYMNIARPYHSRYIYYAKYERDYKIAIYRDFYHRNAISPSVFSILLLSGIAVDFYIASSGVALFNFLLCHETPRWPAFLLSSLLQLTKNWRSPNRQKYETVKTAYVFFYPII